MVSVYIFVAVGYFGVSGWVVFVGGFDSRFHLEVAFISEGEVFVFVHVEGVGWGFGRGGNVLISKNFYF